MKCQQAARCWSGLNTAAFTPACRPWPGGALAIRPLRCRHMLLSGTADLDAVLGLAIGHQHSIGRSHPVAGRDAAGGSRTDGPCGVIGTGDGRRPRIGPISICLPAAGTNRLESRGSTRRRRVPSCETPASPATHDRPTALPYAHHAGGIPRSFDSARSPIRDMHTGSSPNNWDVSTGADRLARWSRSMKNPGHEGGRTSPDRT